MRIRYNYDVGLIKNAGILSMHKAFCQLLERFLASRTNVDVNKVVLRPDKETPEQRRTEFISQVLSRNEIFKFYSLKELATFSSKCLKVCKFAEEAVLESGKQTNALFILTSGKIVVETVGKDRNVKMIHVLRPGDMFGIECMLSDSTVDFTYRAVTEMVELIKIPADFLKSELDLHPKLHTLIMNIQNNQLNKLAKLLAAKDL